MKMSELLEGAVEDLEKDLRNPYSYDAIDHMMTSIAKKHGVSPKKLHDLFVEKHGEIPDDWAKKLDESRLAEKWSEKYKSSINCSNPKGFSQRAHCQGRKKEEDYHPNALPAGPEFKPTMPAGTVRVDVSDVYDWYKLGKNIANLKQANPKDFGKGPPSTIMSFGSEEEEHEYISALKKLGLTTTDIDPLDPNQPKGMPRQKTDPTYNVNEFATDDGDNGEEDVLHKFARMWYKGNDAVQRKVERALDRQGWEIGEIESEEGGVFVVRSGDENGNSYIGFSLDDLTENFADGRNPQDKGDSKRYGVPTKASVSTLRKVAKQGGRKGQLAHWMANMKAGKAKKK